MGMYELVTLRKVGESAVVTVPKTVLEESGLQIGDRLVISTLTRNTLTIGKASSVAPTQNEGAD